jgi:hypothetical protein
VDFPGTEWTILNLPGPDLTSNLNAVLGPNWAMPEAIACGRDGYATAPSVVNHTGLPASQMVSSSALLLTTPVVDSGSSSAWRIAATQRGRVKTRLIR